MQIAKEDRALGNGGRAGTPVWTPHSPTSSLGRNPRGAGRPAPGKEGRVLEGGLGKRIEGSPGGCPLSEGRTVPTSQSTGRHCLPP